MFLRENLWKEFPHPGKKFLFWKEPFFFEISGGDIEQNGTCQPEERSRVKVVSNSPGRTLYGEDNESKWGYEADDMDIGKDTREEKVAGCYSRKEDRNKREFLKTAWQHADEQGVCKEEENDRDERKNDQRWCPDVKGKDCADSEHAEKIRE